MILFAGQLLASIFRGVWPGRVDPAVGGLVRRLWHVGCDCSPGVARGRAFQGRVGLSSGRVRGEADQPKAARIWVQAAAIACAQRQVASIHSRVCRALQVMRAATCRTRYRNVAISQRANSEWSVKPMVLVQAIRSIAAMMISSQAELASKALNGKLRRPVALAWRIRSSTRACWRCRSSSPGS